MIREDLTNKFRDLIEFGKDPEILGTYQTMFLSKCFELFPYGGFRVEDIASVDSLQYSECTYNAAFDIYYPPGEQKTLSIIFNTDVFTTQININKDHVVETLVDFLDDLKRQIRQNKIKKVLS